MRLKVVMLCGLLALSGSVSSGDEKAKTEETTKVKLQGLTLTIPKSWAAPDAPKPMRLATYEIAPVEGDKEKAELAISSFPGGGGGVAPNLTRWISQFDADGRESVIKQGKANGKQYYIVDITGTYKKSVGPPVLQKTESVKGSRMLGVILVQEDDEVYFLKLTGPDKTVKAQSEILRSAFGAKSEGEEDYEL